MWNGPAPVDEKPGVTDLDDALTPLPLPLLDAIPNPCCDEDDPTWPLLPSGGAPFTFAAILSYSMLGIGQAYVRSKFE